MVVDGAAFELPDKVAEAPWPADVADAASDRLDIKVETVDDNRLVGVDSVACDIVDASSGRLLKILPSWFDAKVDAKTKKLVSAVR